MASALLSPEVQLRLNDIPRQVAALARSLRAFKDEDELYRAFQGHDATQLSRCHAVEAGVSAVENHFGEIAQLVCDHRGEVWHKADGSPRAPSMAERYERLEAVGIIPPPVRGDLAWIRQIRNALSHRRLTYGRPVLQPDELYLCAEVLAGDGEDMALSLRRGLLGAGYRL